MLIIDVFMCLPEIFPGPQPLPQQDVCSLILDPWDVHCIERQQFPLGQQQEDLMHQSA